MDINTKACQVFEYLLAVNNITQKVIRNINEYEKVWLEKDIPDKEGCFLNGTGKYKDAWFEIHKQELETVPELPEYLSGWIKKYDDPLKKPEKVQRIQIEKEYSIEWKYFEDDEKRTDTLNEWLDSSWQPWSERNASKKRIQNMYNEFFLLYQRFQSEGSEIELAYGRGMLNWNVQKESIKRPLLVTPLELKFDAKEGVFTLYPTSKGTVIETDMLLNIDIPNAESLQEIRRGFSDEDFDIKEEKNLTDIFKEILNIVSPRGTFIENEKGIITNSTEPCITYTPLIFLRKADGRIWNAELSGNIEKIRNGFKVPDPIKLILTDDKDEIKKINEAPDEKWNTTGDDLLFPLPSNEEQKLIAKKIALNPGVVVQGPPGTGKSHTIANLICHLLSHGKRVLVTSEKERALKVLRDKIPEEIRPFCVAILGSDSDSIKDIENSIKNISECIDSFDPGVLKKDISFLKGDLYNSRKKTAEIKNMIDEAGELENKKVNFNGMEMTPIEISRWLAKNKDNSWIRDSISIDDKCPLTHIELELFFKIAEKMRSIDVERLKKLRPLVKDIPSALQFSSMVDDLKKVENRLKNECTITESWNVSDKAYENLDEYKKIVQSKVLRLNRLKEPWQKNIMEDYINQDGKYEFWSDLKEETEERIRKVQEIEKDLYEYDISFPDSINKIEAKNDVMLLKKKLNGNEKIGWMLRNITGRKYSYIFDSVKLNGLPLKNANDVEVILKFLEKSEIEKKMELKWNNIMEKVDGKSILSSSKKYFMILNELLKKLEESLIWSLDEMNSFQKISLELGICEKIQWSDENWFKKIYEGLDELGIRKHYETSKKFFDDIKLKMLKCRESVEADSSWNVLLKACEGMDTAAWEKEYDSLLMLEGKEEDFKKFQSYANRLKGKVPMFVKDVQNSMGTDFSGMFENFDKAWMYSQGNSYLEEIKEKTDIQMFEKSLKQENNMQLKILKEVVLKSTWLYQIERTTEPQRRSLFAWAKAIQRIGKGTGKYANMYRREAKKEMKVCKDAIPVWIMSIQKVIENIELSDNLFDVIIVDESSQSGLNSLCALLRAEKAVVVGDENQISPESIGTDLGMVNEIVKRYLKDIPQAERFETKTSLYDIASQIFASKILLKEHFRCVPEIIQFSNDFMYEGKMIPLRLPLSGEVFDPPVSAVFVKDGFRDENTTRVINMPEAEALVKMVKECIDDSKYNNKTMGVISLQGHDQANLIEELLRKEIGEAEMIQRKLICGDAYYFQGDERDIIFLSMVAAPNMRTSALTRRSDYQRFNVAASRARDQMILFHSVSLNNLNPECARYRLLEYCENPHRVQEEIDKVDDLFESEFERDVFKVITLHGYRVVPQVKVGTLGKRIDMVVEGLKSRLAVECDGDRWHGIDKWEQDIERQRVLERVGWTFLRIRGSVFYRDPKKAMEPLWEKLDDMGIEKR